MTTAPARPKPPPAPAAEAAAFFDALRSSRLMPATDIEFYERELRPGELNALCDLLVEEELLTPYQVGRLRRGEPRGLLLGPYRVLDRLGQGGGGEVYRAQHAVMGRTVAVKVVSPEYGNGGEGRELFKREVAAATGLAHPNVALTYDANEQDGLLYLAMEYVYGPTLQDYVIDEGPLAVPLGCTILIQAAQALQHAHGKGLVHRDVKPANIMLPGVVVAPDPQKSVGPVVKLVDFGLARCGPQSRLATIACPQGATLGTPAFIAPEQIRDVHKVDIRSDLYSLGCTMYFAFTGELPFEANTIQAIYQMHLSADAPRLAAKRPDIPPALCEIVRRLMAKQPSNRYQTPSELIDAVNAFILGGGLASGAVPMGALSRPVPAPAPRTVPPPTPPRPVRADLPPTPARPTPTTAPPAAEEPLALLVSAELPAAADVPVALSTMLAPTEDDTPAEYDPEADAELRRLWESWRGMVESRLEKKGGPPPTEREYKATYRKLLAALAAARRGADEETSEMFRKMAAVAEPWVSVRALAQLDRKTLENVARSSAALSAEAWPTAASGGGAGKWLAAGLAVAAGLAACAAFVLR